jgi:hypothetical protein
VLNTGEGDDVAMISVEKQGSHTMKVMAEAVPLPQPALHVYIRKKITIRDQLHVITSQLTIQHDSILSIEYMRVIAGHNPNLVNHD